MFVYLSSLFLLGLIFGSFVSAVSYRIPRNINFTKGRSFCDSCKKELFWYDNIPLFSYLLYQGKSRCCKKNISIRYPLIEIISGIMAVLLFLHFGIMQFLIFYSIFLITLTIFIIDLEHQIIPDGLSWILILLGLIGILLSPQNINLYSSLFSGFVFSFALLLLHIITKGKGMGLGDVKLAIGLGIILNLSKGLTWLMLSFLTGGVIASILLITGRAKLKTKIAFGPFLIFAFWLTLFFIK